MVSNVEISKIAPTGTSAEYVNMILIRTNLMPDKTISSVDHSSINDG